MMTFKGLFHLNYRKHTVVFHLDIVVSSYAESFGFIWEVLTWPVLILSPPTRNNGCEWNFVCGAHGIDTWHLKNSTTSCLSWNTVHRPWCKLFSQRSIFCWRQKIKKIVDCKIFGSSKVNGTFLKGKIIFTSVELAAEYSAVGVSTMGVNWLELQRWID